MKKIPITDIPGFGIGNAQDLAGGTGCTVILCKDGAAAGVDVRGGGPATRDTDLLASKNTVQQVHGIVLGGGSAYGLEAATGVMKYLSEQGIGLPVTADVRVPIVVQADIFDLAVGEPVWPDVKMGYEAAKNAESNLFSHGVSGAGTGASVGKILGPEKAMKSGLGTGAFVQGDLMVGAVVAVNACGEVFEMDSRRKIAGVLGDVTMEDIMMMNIPAGKNTTIGCVITNGRFTKAEMNKLASLAQNGLVRTIHPVNMTMDGDTMFAACSDKVQANLDVAGVLAVYAVAEAVETAVRSAVGAYGLKGAADD